MIFSLCTLHIRKKNCFSLSLSCIVYTVLACVLFWCWALSPHCFYIYLHLFVFLLLLFQSSSTSISFFYLFLLSPFSFFYLLSHLFSFILIKLFYLVSLLQRICVVFHLLRVYTRCNVQYLFFFFVCFRTFSATAVL